MKIVRIKTKSTVLKTTQNKKILTNREGHEGMVLTHKNYHKRLHKSLPCIKAIATLYKNYLCEDICPATAGTILDWLHLCYCSLSVALLTFL